MTDPKPFIDTNILLCLFSEKAERADRAEEIVRAGGRTSVQVLNELANVARRKLTLSWEEINEILTIICSVCPADALTLETHERGMIIAERYKISIYDSMIIASALLAGCETLYSEDMQDELLINQQLCILNPFAKH